MHDIGFHIRLTLALVADLQPFVTPFVSFKGLGTLDSTGFKTLEDHHQEAGGPPRRGDAQEGSVRDGVSDFSTKT